MLNSKDLRASGVSVNLACGKVTLSRVHTFSRVESAALGLKHIGGYCSHLIDCPAIRLVHGNQLQSFCRLQYQS